ncbi:glycosyltransferase [uncultured Chloroflexus sp.]|uniref:glycosyltransferase n=1 Tax=uncultured Chloroflexus sp. TaxID=214040 RepID=UPI002605E543|nr:glycosyltransferase [uncultured Chloroflexus sp.]
MHILQLYKDYPPVQGGIEGHLQLLSEGLTSRGHRVTVLYVAPGRQGRHEWRNGVELIATPRLLTLARAPISPALLWQVTRCRPDLIHFHHPYPVGDLALLATRAPLVVTYHSDIVRQRVLGALTAPLIHHTLRRAACIIASSPAIVQSSLWLARHRERVRVVPFGLPPLPLPDPALVAALRRRFPGPNALFVGRLRYYKGVDRLVRALALLPRGHAIIAGGDATVRGSDLARLANELGIGERVHVLGAVDNVTLRALYAIADVFVLPSVAPSEAFGIVQIEAQMAGLPVICTELGTGTSYVTIHGRTGFVVPPDNPPALARALAELFANPVRARALGLAGRERALAEFRLERMLDRIETVYAEICNRT